MRTTVILFILLFFTTHLKATHNRAGEITFEQTSDLEIKAILTTYTKISSIPADRDSLTICWGDGICEALMRSNNGGEDLGNDYKVNIYIGFHRYADLGEYTISMTDPNRNGSILNVNAPNSDFVPFHIESTCNVMDISMEGSNRSPSLLEAPMDIGFIHQPFMHTPNAVDLDGDSIAYELVTPLMETGMEVPKYVQVDKIGEGAANQYSFDEVTGLFLWNSPQVVGEYNIAMKIKAYRNGVLWDVIIRDMQILILPEGNNPPEISSEDLENSFVEINAGKELILNFVAIEPDEMPFDGVPHVTVTSEIFDKGAEIINQSSFGSVRFSLNWSVDEKDVRPIPYQVAIKAVDSKGLSTFMILRIKVNPFSTSTKETFQNLGFQLFPNPTNEDFIIQLPDNQQRQSITVTIYDTFGRLLQKSIYDQAQQLIRIETNQLQAGNYFVNLESNTTSLSAKLIKY